MGESRARPPPAVGCCVDANGVRAGGPGVWDHAAVSAQGAHGSRGFSLHPSERLLPVRRLSPAECDAVGFAGPLVLARRQLRWYGPWRTTGGYVVVRHRDEVVLACSRAELQAVGVEPGTDDRRRLSWSRAIGWLRHRDRHPNNSG